MLIPISRLIGIPVLSLQTGMPLARIDEPIIDPRNLRVRAFRVIGSRLSHALSVLHAEDIREVNELGVIVDNDDSLMPLDDLVRLQEIIDFHFELIGIRVETEHRRKLGKVGSFSIDQTGFTVEQLYVRPTLTGSFLQTSLTVHRSQIVSIDNSHIVVKDAVVKDEAPLPTPSKSFANPFRGQAQQPEN